MLSNNDHAAILSRVADAGGRAAATSQRSYHAETPAELDAALEAIQARILAESPGCVPPSPPPDLGSCPGPSMLTGGPGPSGDGAGQASAGACSLTGPRPRGTPLLSALPLLALALMRLGRRRPGRAQPQITGPA